MKPLVTVMKLVLPCAVVLAMALLSSCGEEKRFFVTTKDPSQSSAPGAGSEAVQSLTNAVSNVSCNTEQLTTDGVCYVGGVIYASLAIVKPPIPCPKGQCDDLTTYFPHLCFFTEEDLRPVVVYINGVEVGKSTDSSYDGTSKLRTVQLPDKKGAEGDTLKIEIPFTYLQGGQPVQGTMTITDTF